MFPNFILWMLIIHILWETSENYMRYNNINKYKVSFINPISHKFAKEMEWIWLRGEGKFSFSSVSCELWTQVFSFFLSFVSNGEKGKRNDVTHQKSFLFYCWKLWRFCGDVWEFTLHLLEILVMRRFWIKFRRFFDFLLNFVWIFQRNSETPSSSQALRNFLWPQMKILNHIS